jgi:hypothetical protein
MSHFYFSSFAPEPQRSAENRPEKMSRFPSQNALAGASIVCSGEITFSITDAIFPRAFKILFHGK